MEQPRVPDPLDASEAVDPGSAAALLCILNDKINLNGLSVISNP